MNVCVISGGGPKGAFAVGALKALDERGLTFDAYVGTSTGALIAPFAKLNRLDYLEQMYTTITPKEIYGTRKWWKIPFKPGFYHFRPLRLKLEKDLSQIEWMGLKDVWVSAFNLNSGRVEYWHSTEAESRDMWVLAMLASASIPIVSDPVQINPRFPDRYVDGGVVDILPIEWARLTYPDANVLAISMGSPIQRDDSVSGMLDIAKRTVEALTHEVLANEIKSLSQGNGDKYKLLELTEVYVGGQKWTSTDMRKQFQHGYEVGDAFEIPASWLT